MSAILLDSSAARSCPVKTQNAFDPTVQRPTTPALQPPPEFLEGSRQFLAAVRSAWRTACPDLVDLTGLESAATVRAMSAGAPVILGGRLPDDVRGHRVGRPDALVRGADRTDGRPQYHPVQIKAHKILDRQREPRTDGAVRRTVCLTALAAPAPEHRRTFDGFALRLSRREGDFLELAHYYRLLVAAGYAAGDALAAVIGADGLADEPVLAWADLADPVVRTFSRSSPDGWRLRSLLERYDHEHAFRVSVAIAAAARTGNAATDPPLQVTPIRVPECDTCPWWPRCRPLLDSDDLSLRVATSPLDVREINALRRQGVGTAAALARADVVPLLRGYLPEVTHRVDAESRVRKAARRARMLVGGVGAERETAGPIAVPAAEIEIDFDVETAQNGRVYLWGFLVSDGSGPPAYRAFSRFADLDAGAETELALAALDWLRAAVDGPRSVAVYHYSAYEVAVISELAARERPRLDWAERYAREQFVDLHQIVAEHFFGVAGLGLKRIAQEAGFGWRDSEPGGLNSQRWFAEAVHAADPEQREAARRRVLAYNEDDVRATAAVREWLRAQ